MNSIAWAATAAILVASIASAAERPALAGHWVAEIAFSDSERVRLVVDLDQRASPWVGEFDVLEFGVENYPLLVSTDGAHPFFSRWQPANADSSMLGR